MCAPLRKLGKCISVPQCGGGGNARLVKQPPRIRRPRLQAVCRITGGVAILFELRVGCAWVSKPRTC